MAAVATMKMVQIVKRDASRQIVYGVVYAPYTLDTFTEFMFPEDIERMAHDFLRLKLDEVIDTNHDRVPNGSYPVESFIARDMDEDPEGAWVLGVKCSAEIWDRVLKGELNAFSFEAMVYPVEVEIEVTTYRDHAGVTEKSEVEAGIEPHEHVYFLQVDDKGKITRGWTDEVTIGEVAHRHDILGGSRTRSAADHSHRFFL